MDLLSGYWGIMVGAGMPQVSEFFDANGPQGADIRWSPAYSRCHSYALLAGVILQKEILGARVMGRSVRLSSYFGRQQHASGVVPTVAGDVRIRWRREGDGIVLDAQTLRNAEVRFGPRDPQEEVRFTWRRETS